MRERPARPGDRRDDRITGSRAADRRRPLSRPRHPWTTAQRRPSCPRLGDHGGADRVDQGSLRAVPGSEAGAAADSKRSRAPLRLSGARKSCAGRPGAEADIRARARVRLLLAVAIPPGGGWPAVSRVRNPGETTAVGRSLVAMGGFVQLRRGALAATAVVPSARERGKTLHAGCTRSGVRLRRRSRRSPPWGPGAMTPRSVLGIALTLVLAQGCAAVQRWEFSRPTLERPESMAIDEKGYVGLPGVKVAVTARNDRATFALAGPAIVVPLPVIPLPGSVVDPPQREPPFWIDVAIDPEGEGFTFAPGEVRLRSLGRQRSDRPDSSEGAYMFLSPLRDRAAYRRHELRREPPRRSARRPRADAHE